MVRPVQIVAWFVQRPDASRAHSTKSVRWQLEVTFPEVRAHLGVETQRQWSALASVRTPPALLGRFSFVTLAAHLPHREHGLPVRAAAWYVKPFPTFADAIALVRLHLWPSVGTY